MTRNVAPMLVAAVLAGCATVPRVPQMLGASVDPSQVTSWTASGRIGVALPGSGGSGTFVWQQRQERTDLVVRGPLGAGGLEIVADGGSLTVTDANGSQYSAAAAHDLIRDRLGGDLPVLALRYWLLGLAAPGADAAVRERSEPPVRTIEQSGWTVAYEAFVAAQGWAVPARLTATSGSVRVKAVIDHWDLAPTGGHGAQP